MPYRITPLLFLTLLCLPTYADTLLHAHSAWVREAPPGAKVLAAYLTIENQGTKAQTLTSVSSPDFAAAEIHVTEIKNGTAAMIRLASTDIPARGRQVLAPGGAHVMLMRPRRTLHVGDSVTLRLRFKSGKVLSIPAAVVHTEHAPTHQH